MGTSLRLTTFTMPAASLGPVNPLPALGGCLPYPRQDGYDRLRRPRGFRVAVLENEILRATFLLDLGARLWSLIHKPSGRELLYVNPVFQPGALAACNAWYSGGVEWNCGPGGHTPLTCSPLFAARVRDDDGSPMLRLYEFERALAFTYQMDFRLPPGSPWLFARMRIVNPHDRELSMYWWSNIAVPETPDLRVLAPAHAAIRNAYDGKLDLKPIPVDSEGRDVSYPVNIPGSMDFFYDIPETQRPWEAALDREGRGLIHVSTPRLRGRKLFVWGMSPGGRHWQEFLSEPGHPYIEIQGGVTQTQGQRFPMAARSEVTWMEAYGLMEADPVRVHGSTWAAAWGDVEERVNRALPAEELERMPDKTAASADRAPERLLHRGSGWGALEVERRRRSGEPTLCSGALVFDKASLGADQAPWLTLLRTGSFPRRDKPGAWMVQPEWRERLERASGSRHWLAWLHLGVMHFRAQEIDRALDAWRQSMKLRPTAWALRNFAVAARIGKRMGEAADLWVAAYRLMPASRALVCECFETLIAGGRSADLLKILAGLPPSLRTNGRIRLLEARAAIDTGDLDRAEAVLLDENLVVPDLREGERMLSDTWYLLQERKLARKEGTVVDDAIRARVLRECPPPSNLDFRMAAAWRA